MLFSKTTRRLFLHLLALYVIVIACISIAFAGYTLFYVWYIPKVKQSIPIYLHYQKRASLLPASFEVDLTDRIHISPGQPYDISLWLDVPDTPENAALGNVMFGIDFMHSATNRTLFRSARPFLLPQRSSLVQWSYLSLRLLPMALGWWQERRKWQLPLMQSFIDPDPGLPVDRVRVWLSENAFNVYSAELELFAKFSGPRYWMYYWFTSTSLLSIAAIAFWLSLLAIILYMTCLQRAFAPTAQHPNSLVVKNEEEDDEEGEEEEQAYDALLKGEGATTYRHQRYLARQAQRNHYIDRAIDQMIDDEDSGSSRKQHQHQHQRKSRKVYPSNKHHPHHATAHRRRVPLATNSSPTHTPQVFHRSTRPRRHSFRQNQFSTQLTHRAFTPPSNTDSDDEAEGDEDDVNETERIHQRESDDTRRASFVDATPPSRPSLSAMQTPFASSPPSPGTGWQSDSS